MKKIILSIIITMIVNAAYSQVRIKSDLQEMNLKGNVKSVRETSYKAVKKSHVIQKGKRKRESPKYDRDFYVILNDKGYKAEENEYNKDGSIYRKFSYLYDDRGNTIEIDWYNSDGSFSNKHKYSNTYVDKVYLTERIHYRPDSSIDAKYTYKYDDKGNMTERNWY